MSIKFNAAKRQELVGFVAFALGCVPGQMMASYGKNEAHLTCLWTGEERTLRYRAGCAQQVQAAVVAALAV